MKDLALRNQTAQYAAIDAAIGNDLDGDLLRFDGKHGGYTRGKDKEAVPTGTLLRFAPLSIREGFQKWIDGLIVDEKFREWNSTEPRIYLEDLDERDQATWAGGKDPWSETLQAAFKDKNGAQLKFTTSSAGGFNALRKLMREWRSQRDTHPDLVPIVKLEQSSYEHKVHKTDVPIPVFVIVDWAPWGDMPKLAYQAEDPADPKKVYGYEGSDLRRRIENGVMPPAPPPLLEAPDGPDFPDDIPF